MNVGSVKLLNKPCFSPEYCYGIICQLVIFVSVWTYHCKKKQRVEVEEREERVRGEWSDHTTQQETEPSDAIDNIIYRNRNLTIISIAEAHITS